MGKFKMTRIEKPAIRECKVVHQAKPTEKLSPMSPGASKRSDEVIQENYPDSPDPRQQIY
jgi:hypothetical protein